MSELREQIIDILVENGYTQRPEGPGGQVPSYYAVIDQLIALYPKPDWEGLEKIINYIKEHHHSHCNRFCNSGHWAIVTNDLLTWAEGKKEKVWCEHISKHFKDDNWYSYLKQGSWSSIEPEWDICPVKNCHKPRPT